MGVKQFIPKNDLEHIANSFYFNNILQVEFVLNHLKIEELDILKSTDKITYLLLRYRYTYFVVGDLGEAEKLWITLNENYDKMTDSERSLYKFIQSLNMIKNDCFEEAKTLLDEVLTAKNTFNRMLYIGELLYYYSYVKGRLRQFQESIIMANLANEYANKDMNSFLSVSILVELTRNYLILGSEKEVKKHLEYIEQVPNLEETMPEKLYFLYHHRGFFHEKIGEYDLALEYYRKSVLNIDVCKGRQALDMQFSYSYFLFNRGHEDSLAEFHKFLVLAIKYQNEGCIFLGGFFTKYIEDPKDGILFLRLNAEKINDKEVSPPIRAFLIDFIK